MGESPRPDSLRIEELRRRVQADPASIAFAALAEEYRRVGQYNDAIETCVAGLKRHPSYLSAHVTLGRALIEVGRYDEAEQELQLVLKAAPENLAAIRGLADIHHRRPDHHSYDQALANAHEEAAAEASAAAHQSAAAASLPVDEPAPVPPPADQYEPPRYDPPGTFDFPEVSQAEPTFAPAASFETSASLETTASFETVAQIEEPNPEPNPELDALERFLEAVLAARATAGAH